MLNKVCQAVFALFGRRSHLRGCFVKLRPSWPSFLTSTPTVVSSESVECLPVSVSSLLLPPPSTSSPSLTISLLTAMHFFTLAILCLVLLGLHQSDASYGDEYGIQLSSCPIECDCSGLSIDCSRRSLTSVPQNIPHEVRRM